MKKKKCKNLTVVIEIYNDHPYNKFQCKLKGNKKKFNRTIKTCCSNCPLQYEFEFKN